MKIIQIVTSVSYLSDFKTGRTFQSGQILALQCQGREVLQSYMLIPQFVSMIIAALQRMYITAWAANDLKEVSSKFCWSVYGASWIGNTKKIKSNIFMMLQRSQKPFVISMGGILPSLTLAYYGSFISSVMSYFMTMRAAIAK